MTIDILYILGGLVLLVLGGNWLVDGASSMARRFGVSPLVIGLTVVAYGTSTPELAVSVNAALIGNANIAVANVVGSNIFNVLAILGLSALIVPLVVSSQLIRLDVPFMVFVSLLLWLFASDGRLELWESAILLLLSVSYTWFIVQKSRKETKAVQQEFAKEFASPEKKNSEASLAKSLLWVGLGLAVLVAGARVLVMGAVSLAQGLGVSDTIIGLTIVAAGTSLPEVSASISAALKGERDIAIGNVVGSNIFNILFILGVSGLVSPLGLNVAPEMIGFDIPVMVAVAVACLPIFFTGMVIQRWEGVVFLLAYLAYTFLLVQHAQGGGEEVISHTSQFVGALLSLTFAVVLWQSYRQWKTPNKPS